MVKVTMHPWYRGSWSDKASMSRPSYTTMAKFDIGVKATEGRAKEHLCIAPAFAWKRGISLLEGLKQWR